MYTYLPTLPTYLPIHDLTPSHHHVPTYLPIYDLTPSHIHHHHHHALLTYLLTIYVSTPTYLYELLCLSSRAYLGAVRSPLLLILAIVSFVIANGTQFLQQVGR